MYDHLYFCHIQKTAGTSLWSAAAEHLPAHRLLYPAQESEMPKHAELGLERFQYIQGHISMCWSYFLGKRCLRFSFVREPMSRFLSLFNFWRFAYHYGASAYPPQSGPHLAASMKFSEFIRHPRTRPDIEQTQARQIFGIYHSFGSAGQINPADFKTRIRKANMHLWTLDSLDDGIAEINARWGKAIFSAEKRENQTKSIQDELAAVGVKLEPVRAKDIDPVDLEFLNHHMSLDIELYRQLRAEEQKPKWSPPASLLLNDLPDLLLAAA